MTAEQRVGIVLRVPLDRALDNREGHRLNVGIDHIDVPVVIDPTLAKRGEFGYAYDYSRVIRLREWNEQVLLHEILHVALSRITPLNTITDDPDDHNVIARIEVALWETGWRFRPDEKDESNRATAAVVRTVHTADGSPLATFHNTQAEADAYVRGWEQATTDTIRLRAAVEALATRWEQMVGVPESVIDRLHAVLAAERDPEVGEGRG